MWMGSYIKHFTKAQTTIATMSSSNSQQMSFKRDVCVWQCIQQNLDLARYVWIWIWDMSFDTCNIVFIIIYVDNLHGGFHPMYDFDNIIIFAFSF